MPFLPALFGVLAAAFALLIETLFFPFFSNGTALFIFFAALIEEGSRFLFLIQLERFAPQKKFWLWAALFFGLSFALAEYLLADFPPFPAYVFMFSIHTILTIFYAFALRFRLFPYPPLFLLGGILIHFLFNIAVLRLF